MKTVLFLCTGNYYRSRFAEMYFNHLAQETSLDWQADSRGFKPGAHNLGAISPYVLQYFDNLEIAFDTPHRLPLALTAADLERADLIVALYDTEHRPYVTGGFPDWIERIEFWQVADVPFTAPEIALPAIQAQVENLITRLKSEK